MFKYLYSKIIHIDHTTFNNNINNNNNNIEKKEKSMAKYFKVSIAFLLVFWVVIVCLVSYK
jgi:hypothetical protein